MTDKSELHNRRGELKLQGRLAEAISVQKQILETVTHHGGKKLANAWNMLSHLLQLHGDLIEAEKAARRALTLAHKLDSLSLEALAAYEMKLATILAGQGRFDDAIPYGKRALVHFADFHDPPDDFLASMSNRVAQMIERSNMSIE